MPFADHTFIKSPVTMTAVIDNVAPINNASAMSISNTGTGVARNVAIERVSTAPGQLVGFIRTEMYVAKQSAGLLLTDEDNGIYCMASQLDLTGGVGEAYGFVMNGIGATPVWQLVRYTAGVQALGSGKVVIAGGSVVGDPGYSKPMIIEFRWALNEVGIGGINLKAQAASGTNPANMETVFDVTLGGAILTSSVAQGLLYGDYERTALDLKTTNFNNTFYSALSVSN